MKRVSTFTDVGILANQIVDTHKDAYMDYMWEGPRFSFTVLLGVGATWGRDGYPGLIAWSESLNRLVCGACCRYARLPQSTYCIHCDRSGRDAELPPISETDRARRRETRKYVPPPGMGGGTSKPLGKRIKKRVG